MAVRGTEAKNRIIEVLKENFKEDYIGEVGGKVYIKVPDGGAQKVQIAISMTCAKNDVSISGSGSSLNGGAFNLDGVAPVEKVKPATTTISEDETEKIKKLLEELGL